MSGPASPLILLDTSIVVDLARNNCSGKAIEQKYALRTKTDRPLISVITQGEMLGIAKAGKWVVQKIDALRLVLNEFVLVEIGPEVSRPIPRSLPSIGRTTERWVNKTICGSPRRQRRLEQYCIRVTAGSIGCIRISLKSSTFGVHHEQRQPTDRQQSLELRPCPAR